MRNQVQVEQAESILENFTCYHVVTIKVLHGKRYVMRVSYQQFKSPIEAESFAMELQKQTGMDYAVTKEEACLIVVNNKF